MKNLNNVWGKIPVWIFLFLCLLVSQSCSKDTPDQHLIRVQVETNSDEPVRIYGIKDSPEVGLEVTRSYENTFQVDSRGFSIEARCGDQNTLIVIKVWVNGRLKAEVSGSKYVTSGDILF